MRVYLDNAATSWPKPETVYQAVDRTLRDVGAAAGRGGYREAVEAGRLVEAARRQCAALLGAGDPSRIVFGANGTDALNLAIHGLLAPGDRAVTTVGEHNSVLRPLAHAARTRDVELFHVRCDAAGYVDPDDVRRALHAPTRLVAISHASNVTGAVQPIAEIAALARAAGARVLIDAAQTAGHVPLDAQALGADLIAASGHKGLLGPLGVGLLYVGPGMEAELEPVRQGGTGVNSAEDAQPAALPERFEAGNLNVPALAGLAAAVEFLRQRSVGVIAAHGAALVERLVAGLAAIEGVRVVGPSATQPRVPVVSFTAAGYDPQVLAAALDSAFEIQCRAGLHCAPRMHEALGTLAQGGAVRFSCGWSTTEADVDRAVAAVAALAAAAK